MLSSGIEGFHLSSGSWVQRLHWNINSAAAEVSGDLRSQAEKSAERTSRGGRTMELLALAEKERQVVGKGRILRLAAGSERETSLPLLHHPEMFRD